MAATEEQASYSRAFMASLGGHFLLFLLFFWQFGSGLGNFADPVVYSITIEGGKQLGGMMQAPDSKEKTQLAPPKQVSAAENKVQEKKQPEPEKKTAKEPEKEAEVSTAKEPVKKPTAKPTVAPKPTVAKPKEPSSGEINKQLEQALQRYRGESSSAGGKGFGAAKLGGAGMGGGIVRPPEFFTYYRILEAHIKSGWRWYDNTTPLIAQISFKISPTGELSEVRVASTSNNGGFDDSALRAVKKANPVPPPPAVVYEYFKDVRMTFDPRQ